MHLIGWITAIEPCKQLEVAQQFAIRHPVDDLLSLDHDYMLLALDTAEALLRTNRGRTSFDGPISRQLLSINPR